MAKSRSKSAVKFKTGMAVDRQGNSIEGLQEAFAEEAKCGCGIDCCPTFHLVGKDIATQEIMVGWFENGSWITGTKEDFNNAVANY